MSAPFPELVFDLGNYGRIAVLPAADTGDNRIYSFLNYFIQDWQTDSQGLPFYIKIYVNFPGEFEGSDYDRDGFATYEISLVTTSSTPESMRETVALRIHSGDLKDPSGGVGGVVDHTKNPFKSPLNATAPSKYFRFKNYKDGDFGKKITITPAMVAGLTVTTDAFGSDTGGNEDMGYTISGTTKDGTYIDTAHDSGNYSKRNSVKGSSWSSIKETTGIPEGYGSNGSTGGNVGGLSSTRLTPWRCAAPGQVNCGAGQQTYMTYYQTRGFVFSSGNQSGEFLPNPMWLAAKYGGFKDRNGNGIPDSGEWERNPSRPEEGPKTYFQVANMSELPSQLNEAFRSIARSNSTGTATSASVNAVLGGGISIQTVYYPEYVNPANNDERVKWVGSVYGLYVDKWGNLREDSNGDQRLTLANGKTGDLGDYVLTFNSPQNPPASPPVCYEANISISRCYDPVGDNDLVLFPGGQGRPDNIHQIKPVWDTGRWLAELDDGLLASGSRNYGTAATLAGGKRRIYYGKTTATGTEMKLFNSGAANELSEIMLYDNYQSILPGTTSKLEATTKLIDYVIGIDTPLWRSRKVGNPWTNNLNPVTWRLGDVINSKPIIVGPPNYNYDLIYGDKTYYQYKMKNATRRQVAYFGGNDGMLHAINLGFYGSLSEGQIGYKVNGYKTLDDKTQIPLPAHELGAELWGFIPNSLLPHLQWLADPDYGHSYYVDLKPLLTDYKVNGKWETVLICGLRLGGRIIEPNNGNSPYHYSEVFALKVTDPETEPTLLWRYSGEQMGLSVGLPTVVYSDKKWYVVLPSGPNTDDRGIDALGKSVVNYGTNSPYDGYSEKPARLIVLKADDGTEVVDTGLPENSNFLTVMSEDGKSFFNDSFLPLATQTFKEGENVFWNNQVIYYGLTISRNKDCIDSGAVYRLQMVNESGGALPVSKWKIKRFYKTERPVTGAVNSTKDSSGNIWILFGTGRFWGIQDLSPCSATGTAACEANHDQYIFGIKEKLDSNGNLTFADRTSESAKIIDVSGAKVFEDGGVKNVPTNSLLKLGAGGTIGYVNLSAVITNTALGYKKKLQSRQLLGGNSQRTYEMVLTQPKVDSIGNGESYMVFTSYEPSLDTCGGFGQSYLHMLDTYTGLPAPKMAISFYNHDSTTLQKGQVSGTITAGDGKATEAIILKTDGKVVVRTSGQNGSIYDLERPIDESLGSAVISWREVLDSGYSLSKEAMVEGLNLDLD
jgi:type IV pilus assembly protein PilY1